MQVGVEEARHEVREIVPDERIVTPHDQQQDADRGGAADERERSAQFAAAIAASRFAAGP